MSVLEKLTEGIVHRDVSKEGQALLNKWEKTGLLEGISDEQRRNGMAVLLENQAKELLREASTMSAGDVEGFASVAFPIVRRVFGGLIANDLVSVQPMSLPSGLIFFLDFETNSTKAASVAGESIYGGRVIASQLTGGVNLDHPGDGGGFYNLGTGYTTATGSSAAINVVAADTALENVAPSAMTEAQKKSIRFDPDVLASSDVVSVLKIAAGSVPSDLNDNNLFALSASVDSHQASQVRRLTSFADDGGINVV